jgi:hypothetical protein
MGQLADVSKHGWGIVYKKAFSLSMQIKIADITTAHTILLFRPASFHTDEFLQIVQNGMSHTAVAPGSYLYAQTYH